MAAHFHRSIREERLGTVVVEHRRAEMTLTPKTIEKIMDLIGAELPAATTSFRLEMNIVGWANHAGAVEGSFEMNIEGGNA